MELNLAQARRFLLAKNGLIGGHRFRGKKGALQYVRQAAACSLTRWTSAAAART